MVEKFLDYKDFKVYAYTGATLNKYSFFAWSVFRSKYIRSRLDPVWSISELIWCFDQPRSIVPKGRQFLQLLVKLYGPYDTYIP